MQGNVLGSEGTNVNTSLFPIYQQMIEPGNKNGIWIKSSESIKEIFFQEDLIKEEIEIDDEIFPNSTYDTFLGIENSIFAIKSDSTTYRYDLETKTYTHLQNMASISGTIMAINVGTDIYVFVTGGSNRGEIYKYDTIDDMVTKLNENCDYIENANKDFLCVIGDEIYNAGYYNAFKYNIIDNIGTAIEESVSMADFAESCSNEIFVFGYTPSGLNDYYQVYKYSPTTNQYTLTNGDYFHLFKPAKIGEIMYFGRQTDDSDKDYVTSFIKYDGKKNIFYKYSFFDKTTYTLCSIEQRLYEIEHEGSTYKLYLLKNKLQNAGNGIYIIFNNSFLYKNMDMKNILDVRKINNGEEQDVEAYIGDGTEWKKLN